jgi:MFS family permease
MGPLLGPTIALLVSVALMWAAQGLTFSVIGLRMVADGFSTGDTGLVASCYFVGQAVATGPCARIIERVGHVRAFAACAAMIAVVTLAYPMRVDLWTWCALRAVHGACIAGVLMVAESWLNGSVPNVWRGRLLVTYSAIQYLAMSGGQQFLHLDSPTGYVLFSIASMMFSLALVPLTLSRSMTGGEVAPSRFGLAQLWRISPLGVITAAAAGMLVGSITGMLPIYLSSTGYGVDDIALFMSVFILGGLVLQYPIGKASDMFDRRTVIAASLYIASALALSVYLIDGIGFWTLVGLSVLYGGISFALYPLALSHANDFIEPADLVAASAGLILVSAAGAVTGPVTAAYTMELIGPGGLYLFSAVVCLALGLFAVFRMTRRPAPAAEAQGPFVLMPETATVAAAEMDPRGPDQAPSAP